MEKGSIGWLTRQSTVLGGRRVGSGERLNGDILIGQVILQPVVQPLSNEKSRTFGCGFLLFVRVRFVILGDKMLAIDKDIPIPVKGYAETLRQMSVGDSFECEYELNRRNGMYTTAKRQNVKILIRRVTGDKMRVWRVE